MAYRKKDYRTKSNRKNSFKDPRGERGVRMGKVFRTNRGILGCYKYVNGKRVAFVRKYRR